MMINRDNYMCWKVDNIIQHFLTHVFIPMDINIIQMIIIVVMIILINFQKFDVRYNSLI